ncbi:hypothetical protein AB0M79_23825 [Polymorphospora sp. NPDC051019]|uniref:hypothetical protein n=1 Tax=Polymorphospora sp. NPDC051019 TaxID=3155725 RepID=UPI00343519AF
MTLAATVRLLDCWTPSDPDTGARLWRVTAAFGKAPTPVGQAWAAVPSPAELAEFGLFPDRPGRHPVGAEPLNRFVPAGAGVAPERPPVEVAAVVAGLLADTFAAGPVPLDERTRLLVEHLAGQLAYGSGDLLRLVVAEPDGFPAGRELHLLGRGGAGRTTRVTVAPAGPVDDRPDLATRTSGVAEVLAGLAWLSNNDRMEITTTVETHGLGLDRLAPAAADAVFRAWWAASERWAQIAERWDDEVPTPLGRGELAHVRADFERHNLDLARSAAWAMGRIGDYDPDDEPQPGFPGDRLVALLTRELFDCATERVTGDPGRGPLLAYGIGLPFEAHEDGEGFYGCLLLVEPDRVGVLLVDAVC